MCVSRRVSVEHVCAYGMVEGRQEGRKRELYRDKRERRVGRVYNNTIVKGCCPQFVGWGKHQRNPEFV